MKKAVSLILIMVMVLSMSACGNRGNADNEENGIGQVTPTSEPIIQDDNSKIPTLAPVATVAPDKSSEATVTPENTVIQLSLLAEEPAFSAMDGGYIPLDFTINAPKYTVEKDLSNIANIDKYPDLTEAQRKKIAENGFVVIPSDEEQLFYVYERNEYEKLPSFITSDSVLQLFHIFYDYSLRNMETEFFNKDIIVMNNSVLNQLSVMRRSTTDVDVLGAIDRMTGYFSVVNMLLEQPVPEDIPADILELAKNDYNQVMTASGDESALLKSKVDFSLMTVRGHYTRSPELEKYFRAMSWYGCLPMYLDSKDTLLCATVATIALFSAPADECRNLWEKIYSATSYMVGEADDITPYEMAEALERVYTGKPRMDEITGKLQELIEEVKLMRKSKIVNKDSENAGHVGELRFMGQRSIPDSVVFQEIVNKAEIMIPKGMDVFAVMGLDRAENYISDGLSDTQVYMDLQTEYMGRSIDEHTQNAYNGWFFSLLQLGVPTGEEYPFFMNNDAWADKSLATILGSWAEIRHDTILYGEQSSAEGGDSDFEEQEEKVYGYVEPNPEFYNRLYWLINNMSENMKVRGIMPKKLESRVDDMLSLLDFLRECSLKELRGENLSDDEQENLKSYGARLESLSSSIAETYDWWLVESEIDRNMAIIADVHTYEGIYEEEAVGTACKIYVAVPTNDKVYLMRGATFDYFEFLNNERLTDETWQEMVKNNNLPERPEFTDSFIIQ